jgi:hypothetical protein
LRSARTVSTKPESVAELPPANDDLDSRDLLNLKELVLPKAAEIPVTENIGEIVRRVLDECSADLADLSAPNEQRDAKTVVDKWGHVADAFARHSVNLRPVRWTTETNERWHVTSHRIHAVLLILEGAARVAMRLGHELSHQPQVETGLWVGHGLTLCSQHVMSWIRRGKAYDDRDTERARVRQILLGAKGVRIGAT